MAPTDESVSVVKELYRHRESFLDHREFHGTDVLEYKGFLLAASELDLSNLKLLPPRQRECFFRCIVLDQSQTDTAELLGVSKVTVQQAVDAGARKLAQFHFPDKTC